MPKILVIEDEAAIRRVLTKILSEENDTYQVDEAEDGLQGIEKIKNEDYDLVLCDIKMPKMDGVEVLEAARKIKPETPIVMISGHGDLETAVNTMRLGTFIKITAKRWYKSSRKRPSSISFFKSLFVAAITRTSTLISLSAPTR